MTTAKFIECDGATWRLSQRSYRRLLKAIAAGQDIDLDRFGKVLIFQSEKLNDLRLLAHSNTWRRNVLDT